MSSISVDKFDLALLQALQHDGRMTNAALGQKVHLSTSQVSRRVQRLEEMGVIGHYSAMLNPEVVGLDVIAFTSVTLGRHGEKEGENFERAVAKMPEVLECVSVTGEADYMLRVVAPDLAAFSEFMMKSLLRQPGVINVKSSIALKKIKQTHVLPLDHVTAPAEAVRKLVLSRA